MIRLILALSLLPLLAAAKTIPLPPQDNAGTDPSFLSFRTNLIRIVKEQNNAELLQNVDPQIEYSFGDGPGKDGFAREWKLNEREDSGIWQEILAVLELGGKFNDAGEFVAPYVFANWPESLDGFDYDAVVVPEAVVRAKANARARAVAKVGYEILALRNVGAPNGWLAVKAPNGKAGYLPSSALRSPIDYRAFFKKVDGEWRMSTFIAGD